VSLDVRDLPGPAVAIELQPGERIGEHGLEKPLRLTIAPELCDTLKPRQLVAYLRLAACVERFGTEATESEWYGRRMAGRQWDELVAIGLVQANGGGWSLRQGECARSGLRLLYFPERQVAEHPRESHASRKRRRRDIRPSLRFAVLERDGFRCVYCGVTAEDSEMHVDHVTPVSKGGTNDLHNLATACVDCNLGKGDREIQ
jgi:hypothetical protein